MVTRINPKENILENKLPEGVFAVMKYQKKSSAKKNENGGISDNAAKILSVIAAIILWFYVIDVQTTQYEKEFNAVPVVIENLNSDSKLSVISGRDNTVDLVLKGTKATLNSLKMSDISASVNMSGIYESGTYDLDVSVVVPSGVSVANQSINSLMISLDRTIGKSIKIEADETYTLSEGYELGEFVISPGHVYISGPEDIVETVNKACISLDLGNIKESKNAKCEIKLYDSYDKEISSPYLKKNESYANITVPVLRRQTKQIKVVFEDGNDYNYTVSPKTVVIKGQVEQIEDMDFVATTPVIIEDNSTTATSNLDLPSGIIAYDKDGNVVTKVMVSSLKRISDGETNE